MAYSQDDQGFAPRAPRPMIDVSSMGLKCAGCGADVTELPFQPSSDRPVYCRDCNRNRNRRPANGGNGGGMNRAPRQMYDVTSMGLKCAGCGADVTELPFQPSSDRPVYCRDCNRNRRPANGGGNW